MNRVFVGFIPNEDSSKHITSVFLGNKSKKDIDRIKILLDGISAKATSVVFNKVKNFPSRDGSTIQSTLQPKLNREVRKLNKIVHDALKNEFPESSYKETFHITLPNVTEEGKIKNKYLLDKLHLVKSTKKGYTSIYNKELI